MEPATDNVIELPQQNNLVCPKCGIHAACRCGVAPITRAAYAIQQNPEKSDRAIADEIGVGNATVSRARRDHQSTVSRDTVQKRTGRDGKARRRPMRKYSSVDIAHDLGSVTSVKQGDSSSKLNLELESSFSALLGQMQIPAAETILREALPQLPIERNLDRAKEAAAAAMEASGAELAEERDDKFNQLLERAKEAQLASLRAEFDQSSQREVENRLSGEAKREIDRARADVVCAQQLLEIWRDRATKCIGALRLLAENWRTLVNCLQPDRSDQISDERNAVIASASDVVKRMKDMIDETEYKEWFT